MRNAKKQDLTIFVAIILVCRARGVPILHEIPNPPRKGAE